MTKGQLYASIIQKLRGKINAYTVHQISEAAKLPNTDTVFELEKMGVLTETTIFDEDFGIQYYYSISPFYVQYLQAQPQTESIRQCLEILFPNGIQKIEQIEFFK